MKELWEKIAVTLRHNQFFGTAIILALVVIFWVYGCTSETASPWSPPEKLNREELNAEIELMNARITTAYADLDKQDLFKQELFNNLAIMAEGGTVNPMGVGLGLLGILGLGAAADNRKKDSVIKTLKNTTT